MRWYFSGFYCYVDFHHNTALPWLHEQRPDWSDRVPDPHTPPPLPDDWVHPTGHKLTGERSENQQLSIICDEIQFI